MSHYTRHEVADAISYALLTGSTINHADFQRFCQKSGGHETSRVFHLIKNAFGIPIRRAGAGGSGMYYIATADREAWQNDPKGMAAAWRRDAKRRADERRMNRLERDLTKLQERHARELAALLERYGSSHTTGGAV